MYKRIELWGALGITKHRFFRIFEPQKAPNMEPQIYENSVWKQHGLWEGLPDAPRTLRDPILDRFWTPNWIDFV